MATGLRHARGRRVVGQWIWPAIGCLGLWVLIGVVTGNIATSTIIENAALAGFLALMGLGEMVVISSGDGAIDLSMPYVMTVCAFVMTGERNNILVALVVCACIAILVGTVNALLVVPLDIPAIIATLAVGYGLETVIQIISSSMTGSPSPGLISVTEGHIVGIPAMVLWAIGACVLVAVFLYHTPVGMRLRAVGQSRRAAVLVGASTGRIVWLSFVLSAFFAGLAGILLAGFSGGAFADMGDSYLLTSIGACIIGGTLISGGQPGPAGTLFGALLLVLVIAFLELAKLPIGVQDIVEGLVLVGVLMFSTSSRAST